MSNKCPICEKISRIRHRNNLYCVAELETGFVLISEYQFYKGYTLFLCKKHVKELHQLQNEFKIKFLKEMSLVAEAVFKCFKPRKLNYELLGNTHPHLHWHIFPRYKNDPLKERPVWAVEESIRCADKFKLVGEELEKIKIKLLMAINKLK